MKVTNKDVIGRKVQVYCSMCSRTLNGIVLDYNNDDTQFPYTVATFNHYLRGRTWHVEVFSEVKFVDWEEADEV